MFVKLKPFLLYLRLFAFLFILIEAEWGKTLSGTVLAALCGSTVCFALFKWLYEPRGGSDNEEASVNTALHPPPSSSQSAPKLSYELESMALQYSIVFVLPMQLLEKHWHVSPLRATVVSLYGTTLLVGLLNWLLVHRRRSDQGEASTNTVAQHPESASQSVPDPRNDPKEIALVQNVSKALIYGIVFIALLNLLEALR